MLNIKEIGKLTSKEKRNLLDAWNKVVATNPTFDGCFDEIERDSRALLAMGLGKTAQDMINNIMGNVITMSVLHYSDMEVA